ncbi:helix-turn-helix domain-containing protein [Methylomicrobium sp. RS1]|uniref:helix-turn-helix domain-containing protein n=1 Tax=Candidatus Methylomicrobium oryzae TaxID=2802053 RepID=UPI001924C4CB|nr:helix-turn-helix domain-containing protein [Methylomicrobium sp. RS1]MBL1262679.1 helix-turn-helix domain-containing protein [Methylomicrobium sp. RS1]
MEPDTLPVIEQGLLTLSEDAWELASRRARFIAPLAALEPIGRQAADDAAEQLGVSRRQVYLLIRRYRQGTGLVTDLAPGKSSGGKGKRRLSEPVERIISDLIHKHFLTRQKCSLARPEGVRIFV